jgi:hypothetical protein
LIGEITSLTNGVVCYGIHVFAICFSLSKDFSDRHFKKFEIFSDLPEIHGIRPEAGVRTTSLGRLGVMKLVTLRRKRAHQCGELDKLSHTTLGSLSKTCGVPHQAHSYSELRRQIHDDLRIQHPEWIQPNGESPMCDAYEARLMKLLGPLVRKADADVISDPDPSPGHGLN